MNDSPTRSDLIAVALVSATLLMTELALTRIFSVVMYYHFAFLAISIALFGLSASGVFAYVFRAPLGRVSTRSLLARQSVVYAVGTLVALFVLVRIHAGLTYSPKNLVKVLLIYAFALVPFFTGGLVVSVAVSRFVRRINAVYAADLFGAASGCLLLIPILDRFGAPGAVLIAAGGSLVAAILFSTALERTRFALTGAGLFAVALGAHLSGVASFDVSVTKGHLGDVVLFSKWNSFSRVGVYDTGHNDWSLSATYHGPLPDTRYMDIDSAASTPILKASPGFDNVQYLRYELTALAYHLKDPGFSALVIGPGGGRDLVSALVFGAKQVDGVEVNPIIANEVMRGQFAAYSGLVYSNPRVTIAVDDGRSFVRRSDRRYDVLQESLVDTWAATAAGAYTLTENTLYTVEAFNDYLDHLTDDGVLTITRWASDGLRLVALAQEACEARGWDSRPRLAIVQQDDVITFLLKRQPFSERETETLRKAAADLGFRVLYAPAAPGAPVTSGPIQSKPAAAITDAYPQLVLAADRRQFYAGYEKDIRPTTDDRPFFFHSAKLKDQVGVVFGRSMLFGNGLSALMTLTIISFALVALFVVAPLAVTGVPDVAGWGHWLVYFGALGAGFMLIEVSVLQRFVLLLGHPVYSLTVTLFSLLLGTGLGAMVSRVLPTQTLRRSTAIALLLVAAVGIVIVLVVTPVIAWAIPFSRPVRILVSVALLLPVGIVLGVPMPAGLRLLSTRAPQLVTWAWGLNGALSVVGATLAIFVAMNWGFRVTLLAASSIYVIGLLALLAAVEE